MRQAKRGSKRKRSRAALPVLGAAGVSLTMAGGASANTPAVEVRSQDSGPRILLAEEEIFDVSLATFYVFEKERDFGPGVRLAAGRGAAAAAVMAAAAAARHMVPLSAARMAALAAVQAIPAVGVAVEVAVAEVAEVAAAAAVAWAYG